MSSAIRYRHGRLFTARDTYVRDGRTVIVQGVCHVAGQDFWEQLNGYLVRAEKVGFDVHFEGVGNDMADPPKIFVDLDGIASLLGLQGQKAGLDYRPHWTRTDISLSELVAGMAPEVLSKMVEATEKMNEFLSSMDGHDQRRLIGSLIRRVMAFGLALPKAGPFALGIKDPIILDRRNEVAARTAIEAEGDVVAVWGAAHLSGIGELLSDAGFRRTNRQWTPVMRVARPR
jgi:hypothetical protein